MKKLLIAISLIGMLALIISLSSFESKNDKKQECYHCKFKRENDVPVYLIEGQPQPYIHDVDSTLMIFPIMEDAFLPKNRRISEIKWIYPDEHFCSTLTEVNIFTRDTFITLRSIRVMSCKITAFTKLTDDQIKVLETQPIKRLIIRNLTTGNDYYYIMKDSLYFIKTYEQIKK